MSRRLLAVWVLALGALLALAACDDTGPDAGDLAVVDAAPIEPDQAAAGCSRDIDCLAAEYCDRALPAEEADAEPPLGMCQPGCRVEPDSCPVGRMCDPDSRACVTDCTCEPGAVIGCEGERLRICPDSCLGGRAEDCPGGQICRGGACEDRPAPMPDMAPPPMPDMAPPPTDMAPPPPDMAPPPPDMAPPAATDAGM